jgi:hypothetical protein
MHRPKLQRAKDPAVAANAILRVEDGPAILELDREREHAPDRSGNRQADRGKGDIEGAFH